MACVMLDVPTDCSFALDVDAREPEPEPEHGTTLSAGNLLHVLAEGYSPSLFRRLVQRCSDKTLNAIHPRGHSVLHALVQAGCHFCHFTPGTDSASAPIGMALDLLQRAESDGGGLDLRQTSLPCSWLPPAENAGPLPCTAHDALLRRHPSCNDPHCRIPRLAAAFDCALERQREFRVGLLPALAATLLQKPTAGVHIGLPVGDVLKLIAGFLLRQ
jgi:hypothetical protein